MAEGITVTLDLAGFGAFQAAVEAEVALAVEGAAEAVVSDAKERAPVSAKGSNGNPPGYLRDHITYEIVEPLLAEVVSEADYSAPVEFGHHHPGYSVPPQPFFTPAVEQERARFAERIAEAIAEVAR